jgi:gamma-glutamyltranspeptidase/glutathione hydrolase
VPDSEWIIQKREAEAEHGMVTSMHPLASAAGLEMLKAGGNAVDAAVATAFAIGVVEPFMSGLGGVAVMVHYQAASDSTVVVDGSSTAPRAARPDLFELLPPGETGGMYGWRGTVADAQNTGWRSPLVPGTPACLLHCLERYGSGRMSRARVMAPAILLAEEGFPVDPYVATTIAFAQRRLRQFPESFKNLFHEDGTPLQPRSLGHAADRLVQPDLARSLRLIADQGAGVLYEGELGERVVADVQANGGILSRDDFRAFRVRELGAGLRLPYRGYELVGVPWTSGCVTAYEALNTLEQFDLAALPRGGVESIHLIAEACRLAFLDRFAHLTDPDLHPAPFEALLDKRYAAEQAARIDPRRASPEATAGDPWPYVSGGRPAGLVGSAAVGGDGCTTHLCAVDRDRNVVSLTSTLGETFGCGVTPKGTGIVLNNGMTWFDPEPGHVNSIEPGKRTLWAPTPTIVLRDGKPYLAVGAPGGRRIMSALVQCLVNALDYDTGVQEAVSAARVHCEGPTTQAEARLARETLAGLVERGHRLEVIEETISSFSFARPNGIRIDPSTGRLTGGVNQFVPATALGH